MRSWIWGYSSVGRALEWHSRGRQFDPDYLHQISINKPPLLLKSGGLLYKEKQETISDFLFNMLLRKW